VLSAEESLACGLATDLAPQGEWPVLADRLKQRASTLSPLAVEHMLALTAKDSRSEDMAAIVATAGRPGLKERIMAYRDRVTAKAKEVGDK
jgi:hypothetical protein